MEVNYLISKFGFSRKKSRAVIYLMENGFQIIFGFGGEIEAVIDKADNSIITGDSLFNYPTDIKNNLLNLVE